MHNHAHLFCLRQRRALKCLFAVQIYDRSTIYHCHFWAWLSMNAFKCIQVKCMNVRAWRLTSGPPCSRWHVYFYLKFAFLTSFAIAQIAFEYCPPWWHESKTKISCSVNECVHVMVEASKSNGMYCVCLILQEYLSLIHYTRGKIFLVKLTTRRDGPVKGTERRQGWKHTTLLQENVVKKD